MFFSFAMTYQRRPGELTARVEPYFCCDELTRAQEEGYSSCGSLSHAPERRCPAPRSPLLLGWDAAMRFRRSSAA